MLETAAAELVEAGTRTGTAQERARTVLDVLVRHVPCDAAWMATVEPDGRGCTSQASSGTSRTAEEHLVPAGVHQALAVPLVDQRQHHVGVLALLYASHRPPEESARRALHHLAPLVARAVAPLWHLAAAAQLLDGATAGAVLHQRGASGELPGLGGDALLAPGSPLLAVARSTLVAGRPSCSFLWPRGGRHAPGGHTRVTVVAERQPSSASVLGAVVLSAVGDCRGLTPRELEVLGLLVEGWSNAQIARWLVLAPRTVATHLEHVMHKLDAATRTLAAVRADREGLYVPAAPGTGAAPAGHHQPACDPAMRSSATVPRTTMTARSATGGSRRP